MSNSNARFRREPIVRLPRVDGSRGAPIGRGSYPWDWRADAGRGGIDVKKTECFKKPARIGALEMSTDGAYDSGGSYCGIGQTIYAATNGDKADCFLMTTRAASLAEARAFFESCAPGLIRWKKEKNATQPNPGR